MSTYVVACLTDGTLNVSAVGPFRSLGRAQEAAERLQDEFDRGQAFTSVAQVVRLETESKVLGKVME